MNFFISFKKLIPLQQQHWLLLLTWFVWFPSQAQSPLTDTFPKESVWYNTSTKPTLKSFNNKLTILLISDINCLECGYYARMIDLQIKQLPAIQLIEVFIAKPHSPLTYASIQDYIQLHDFDHPIAVFPTADEFRNSTIQHLPTFIVYDRTEVPTFTAEGLAGYEKVNQLIHQFKSKSADEKKRYSTYSLMPAISNRHWANPLIEFPTYLCTHESRSGFYVNDAAHHRILHINPQGQCESVAGSSILPGFDNDQEGTIQFQQAHGIAEFEGKLYVADTYNNRLRIADANNYQAQTILGNGQIDSLALPTAVTVWQKKLYVCDGLYNQIRTVNVTNRTSTLFAQLPNQYVNGLRIYPIQIYGGRKKLYIIFSDGSLMSMDKKGKTTLIPLPSKAKLSSVVEWYNGLAAASTSDNAIYYYKKNQWIQLTQGKDSILIEQGIPPLKNPTDLAVVAGELFVTDRDNHIIRYLKSPKNPTPHVFPLVINNLLLSEEPAHTYGQPVTMDTLYVNNQSIAVTLQLDLQGYTLVEEGFNYAALFDSPLTGEVLDSRITSKSFSFTIEPTLAGDFAYVELYLTLQKPQSMGTPIIKRSYLVFPVENSPQAKSVQVLNYRPDLLPHE